MKIDTNRVAAYLAGNFPPYYETFPKIEFILLLTSKAEKVFEKGKFDLIEKHTSSLQQFFSESLNLLKNHEKLLIELIDDLKIPFEARGPDFVRPSEELKTRGIIEKTIGFITPFDENKKHEKLQSIIQSILDESFSGWNIEFASLEKDGDGKYLWSTIDDFLEKYPLYIIDFRDGNLNVAIELGGVLKSKKDSIVITTEELPSDIRGFIYVKKPTVDMEDDGTDEARKEFKERLVTQLKRFIDNQK